NGLTCLDGASEHAFADSNSPQPNVPPASHEDIGRFRLIVEADFRLIHADAALFDQTPRLVPAPGNACVQQDADDVLGLSDRVLLQLLRRLAFAEFDVEV